MGFGFDMVNRKIAMLFLSGLISLSKCYTLIAMNHLPVNIFLVRTTL